MRRLWERISTPFAILVITLIAVAIWHLYNTHVNNKRIIELKQKENARTVRTL